MEHLTENQFAGYLKRSLAPADLLAADGHLRDCEDCRRRLRDSGAIAPPELTLARIGSPHLTYQELEERVEGLDDATSHSHVETHLAICASCRAEYEDLHTFRNIAQATRRSSVSARPKWSLTFWWRPQIAIAALGVVILVSVSWWWLRRAPAPVTTIAHEPAAAPLRPSPASPRPATKLELLARVDPPLYRESILRGEPNQAQVRFREAMHLYGRQDYASALPALEAASQLDPTAPGPRFYAGVCELLQGQTDQAAASFQRTISLGESLYLEKAYFYLAKALLRKGDAEAAARALEATMRLHGDLEADSRRLLSQVREAVQSRP